MRTRSFVAFGAICAIAFVVLIVMLTSANQSRARPALISADEAILYSLDYAKDNGLSGGLVGKLAAAHGQIMGYNDAVRLVYGGLNDPNMDSPSLQAKTVWLIMLYGDFVAHAPQLGPDKPAMDFPHKEMAILMDATNGDIIERVLMPVDQPLRGDGLPALSLPSDINASPKLPRPIVVTEAPLPTSTPAAPAP